MSNETKQNGRRLTPDEMDELAGYPLDHGLMRSLADLGCLPNEDMESVATSLPFCACGRRLSECDQTRRGCRKGKS